MKKINWMLIRNIALIVLAVSSLTCFIIAGVKASGCASSASEVNSYTAQIEYIMFNTPDWNVPGSAAYQEKAALEAERLQANYTYSESEKGLTALSIAGAITIFAAVYLLVNTTHSSRRD